MRLRSLIVMVAALGMAGLAGCDAPAPAVDPNLAAQTQTQVVTAPESGPAVAEPPQQVVSAVAPPPAKDLKFIQFANGSDTFIDAERSKLTNYARYLAKFHKSVILTGYTRKMSDMSAASDLSKRRAEGIRRYLILHDVAASQIEVVSKGDGLPVDTGATEEAQAKNDRVELETVDKLSNAN